MILDSGAQPFFHRGTLINPKKKFAPHQIFLNKNCFTSGLVRVHVHWIKVQ